MKNNLSFSKLIVVITIFISIVVSSNINWGKKSWDSILQSDARGYYAYLPAVFIYHDLNFQFFEKIEKGKYYNANLYYDYRIGSKGSVINKYYCGTALAELPFFLIAHLFSYLMDYETDGYSRLYPILISVAALFYLFIGLLSIEATLTLYNFKEKEKAWVLLSCVFGTNLFYYTIGEPGMSHVFSFAFIALFIYLIKHFLLFNGKKYLILSGVVFGIIVLIRPVNGLVLFIIPFLAGDDTVLKSGMLAAIKNRLQLITALIGFTGILFIQLVIYKISTGNFLLYSYGGEGFNFLNPHFMEILFSYKKGLFLYTPLYLLSFTGLYFLFKKSKFSFFSAIAFFLLLTYVFSSWWMWFYGGSFSSRVYIEFLPFFMLLLGYAIHYIKTKPGRIVFLSILAGVILLCQIQTYQYRYSQIHWSDMTKEKYWDVFLRIDRIIK